MRHSFLRTTTLAKTTLAGGMLARATEGALVSMASLAHGLTTDDRRARSAVLVSTIAAPTDVDHVAATTAGEAPAFLAHPRPNESRGLEEPPHASHTLRGCDPRPRQSIPRGPSYTLGLLTLDLLLVVPGSPLPLLPPRKARPDIHRRGGGRAGRDAPTRSGSSGTEGLWAGPANTPPASRAPLSLEESTELRECLARPQVHRADGRPRPSCPSIGTASTTARLATYSATTTSCALAATGNRSRHGWLPATPRSTAHPSIAQEGADRAWRFRRVGNKTPRPFVLVLAARANEPLQGLTAHPSRRQDHEKNPPEGGRRKG